MSPNCLFKEIMFVFLFVKEDHYALLVKAWETKVFPTIRRRFRNEAERKSGLDQIKGALQLGECLFLLLAKRVLPSSFIHSISSQYVQLCRHFLVKNNYT